MNGMLYATFASGLGGPVGRLLNGRGCGVRLMLDGAAVYERRKEIELPAFNNVYEVLVCEKWKGRSLDGFMKKVLADGGAWKKRLRFNGARTGQPSRGVFRIVTSVENKLVSVDGKIKTRLEDIIASVTGLTPDRGGNGREYLFLIRGEGYAFFLKRLTYHKAHEKVLQKGELRPELCYMLNYLSGPSPGDRVLDPFCGCGGIAAARVRHFPCRAVYASDADLRRLNISSAGFNNRKLFRVVAFEPGHIEPSLPDENEPSDETSPIFCREADIGALSEWLPPASVNKIVTDPPWGVYDAELNIAELYAVMFKQFERALTDDGVIVLLTARKELVRELLRDRRFGLAVTQAYDILVSGKKAGVFVIKKELLNGNAIGISDDV
jgi:predicted RNA methylase